MKYEDTYEIEFPNGNVLTGTYREVMEALVEHRYKDYLNPYLKDHKNENN